MDIARAVKGEDYVELYDSNGNLITRVENVVNYKIPQGVIVEEASTVDDMTVVLAEALAAQEGEITKLKAEMEALKGGDSK